jgi:hypothetical protein
MNDEYIPSEGEDHPSENETDAVLLRVRENRNYPTENFYIKSSIALLAKFASILPVGSAAVCCTSF